MLSFWATPMRIPPGRLVHLSALISQQVDGVIIAPYDNDAQRLDQLLQRNIATVIIDRRIEGRDVDSVNGDSIAGARALTQHLIRLGHKTVSRWFRARQTPPPPRNAWSAMLWR